MGSYLSTDDEEITLDAARETTFARTGSELAQKVKAYDTLVLDWLPTTERVRFALCTDRGFASGVTAAALGFRNDKSSVKTTFAQVVAILGEHGWKLRTCSSDYAVDYHPHFLVFQRQIPFENIAANKKNKDVLESTSKEEEEDDSDSDSDSHSDSDVPGDAGGRTEGVNEGADKKDKAPSEVAARDDNDDG
jgi:hypothetical protein